MMDTILNLGMNDQSVEGVKAKTGNGRFAKDSYRRFIQMFGNVVLGIDKDKFEHESAVNAHAAKIDTDHSGRAFRRPWPATRARAEGDGQPFPQDPVQQLRVARPCSP
jgi:pyruvate,orthophosphate dikinase